MHIKQAGDLASVNSVCLRCKKILGLLYPAPHKNMMVHTCNPSWGVETEDQGHPHE